MEQMNVDEEKKVFIDYESDSFPKSVRNLRPLIYMDGNDFCIVLGPDPEAGIFGQGSSLDEAIRDWDNNLRTRMEAAQSDDEVAQYVTDMRNASVNDVW